MKEKPGSDARRALDLLPRGARGRVVNYFMLSKKFFTRRRRAESAPRRLVKTLFFTTRLFLLKLFYARVNHQSCFIKFAKLRN